MGVNPPIAGFGTTDLNKVAARAGDRPVPPSKYKEFMDAIHGVAFSDKNIDEQTGLEWENIEGEVMGSVLVQDILSGTMLLPVRNRLFKFKSCEKQMQLIFAMKFAETVKHNPQVFPSISTGKQKLNELMVSFQRAGRIELVEMVKAFQVQLQDTQRADDKLIRR